MLTKRDYERLESTFLFQNCDPKALLSSLPPDGFRLDRFDKDEVIYSAQSFRREIGILLSGRVTVTKRSGLIVSELLPGDLFGAAAIYTDQEEYVSTLTVRSRAKVLFLSRFAVEMLVDTDKTVRQNYLTYLTGRIRFLSAKIEALTQDSSAAKLRAYLLRHMDEDGKVTPELSMTELAARLNMGRASLYRELNPLLSQNIVSKEGKKITVLQPGKLQDTKGDLL